MAKDVSIVISARNDNHGGNLIHRFANTLRSVTGLASHRDLDAEVIIVEWNPPQGRPELTEISQLSDSIKEIPVKIIKVPPSIHERFPNSDTNPLHQYAAKNTGIRRSDGEYIVATNLDVIFNEKLINYMKESLVPGAFYRVDRHDLDTLPPTDISIQELLEVCENSVRVVQESNQVRFMDGRDPIDKVKTKLFKYVRELQYTALDRRKVRYDLRRLFGRSGPGPQSPYDLHLRCSGDFLLMHSDDWQRIKGYPELGVHSVGDTYGVIKAAAAGLTEVVLSGGEKIFHQPHRRDSNRPSVDWSDFVRTAEEMLETGSTELHNDDDWGLRDVELEEKSLTE